MCLRITRNQQHQRQQSRRSQQSGSALVIAIFVIVVMSSLAMVLTNNLRQEDSNLSLDVNQTRAWAAAQSGADWALARVLNRGAETAVSACTGVSSTSLTPSSGLTSGSGFSHCQVALNCVTQTAAPGDDVSDRFLLTATASCGRGAAKAEQVIEVLAYD
ncbi:MSHA biogenesis protein MshP [uncultured Ferrimonas sp.]|uniref:MSHA biogenesis protein MshP n=1 Tax=uncultured Ferrimonas sp. TaxID=432640 RepID=UPI00262B9A74|nr:MSHA biogenesis protein MshP [uncultured Ferrimonas sp.]